MPRNALLRFLLKHSLIGTLAGWTFAGAVILFDVASVGSLIMTSDIGLIAALMLAVFSGLTFASVQVTFAVLDLGRFEGDGPGGRKSRFDKVLIALANLLPASDRQPVPVRIRAPDRR